MISSDIAIKVSGLTKVYKLYNSPIDRLKEALSFMGHKYHKDFYALNDISFEIKKGDTIGIVGKNGAGKSTLLKIITGVLTPTNGTVEVNGKISALLELGAGFNPEYTGLENIYFQGGIMGYSREDMDLRVDAIVGFADIGDFIHQPVKMYSSGMFARLAFAVAINVEPDILIVDEALSTGDFLFQFKCLQRIKAFQESGVTVIFVSHSSQSIIEYCNSAIFIDNGNLMYQSDDVKKVIFMYEEFLRNHRILHVQHNANSIADAHFDLIDSSTYDFNCEPNLSIKEHRIGTHNAILREIIFHQNNRFFKESIMLISGHKVRLEIIIMSKLHFINVVMGMSIRTISGLSIWGDNTLNSIKHNMSLQPGENRFEFEFDLNIMPGEYLYFIGLADISGENRVELDQRWPAKKISIISDVRQAEGFVYSPLKFMDKAL